MATNFCTCDLNNLNLAKKDIIVSKVPLIYHGYDSARKLELDILWYIDNYNLDWGTIHHCKLHVDEKAATAVIFLRFCNPDVHERVIAEMNRIEWPAKSNNTLRFEFNRKYTKLHQALNRERLTNRNAETQTQLPYSLEYQPKITQVQCNVGTQTENFAAQSLGSQNLAAPTLAAHSLAEIDLIDLNYDDSHDKYEPLKAAQSSSATLNYLKFTSNEFKPTLTVNSNVAIDWTVKQNVVAEVNTNKVKLEASKIKKNPLDDIISVAEFKKMLEGGDKEAWTRNDWDNMIGLKEVFDSDGSVLGYSSSESTEFIKIEATNRTAENFDLFSESSSVILFR